MTEKRFGFEDLRSGDRVRKKDGTPFSGKVGPVATIAHFELFGTGARTFFKEITGTWLDADDIERAFPTTTKRCQYYSATTNGECGQLAIGEVEGMPICLECGSKYRHILGEVRKGLDETLDETDSINPDHYKAGGIETIAYMQAKLSPEEFRGYLKGNAIKYMSRAELKGGAEDYRKAQWYVNKLVEVFGQ